MNRDEITARIFADPYDDSQDLLDAVENHPEHKSLINEVREFDQRMSKLMHGVLIPKGLAERLKSNIHGEVSANSPVATPGIPVYKWFALAASLALVVGLPFSLLLLQQGPSESEVAIGQSVIRHVLGETAEFAGAENVNFSAVNQVMARVGGQMQENELTRDLDIIFAKTCLVLPGQIGAHFVMQGDQGSVDVILIKNEPVSREFKVDDDRFAGMVSPMGSGNLVLIGEKSEALENYRNVLAENIDWVI